MARVLYNTLPKSCFNVLLAVRVPAQLSKWFTTLSIYPFMEVANVPAFQLRRISMLMYLDFIEDTKACKRSRSDTFALMRRSSTMRQKA